MGTGQLQIGIVVVEGLSFEGREVESGLKEGQQLPRCFLKRNHLGDVLGKCHHQALQVPGFRG